MERKGVAKHSSNPELSCESASDLDRARLIYFYFSVCGTEGTQTVAGAAQTNCWII